MKYEVELTEEQARNFLNHWEKFQTLHSLEVLDCLADAIRANPPKPPRMEEPGWGEKVWASAEPVPDLRECWVSDGSLWHSQSRRSAVWDRLRDPEPWRADA